MNESTLGKGRWRGLLGFAAATAVTSALAGAFTQSSVHSWYPGLSKPSWTPPSNVFGPAWMILYAAMTVAAWRLWQRHGWGGARRELRFFFAQLFLNALWPALFFGLRNPLAGAVEIVLLWAVLLVMVIQFWKRDWLAGMLLVPYLLWISFAAALTISIYRLNAG